jgi:hypothetical protein
MYPRTNKIHVMLVLGLDLNFIVHGKTIHERKYLTTCTFIDNLVNKWGWKIFFRESFVQVTKLHTYVDHTLHIVDRNRVHYPFLQLHRIDKTIFDEFLFFNLYHCFLVRIDRVKFMLNRINIRVSCDIMFNDTWINS